MKRHNATPFVALPMAVALSLTVGCTRHHTVHKTDTGAPKYDRLELVYELRDGRGALSSSTIQPVQFVSAEAGDDGLLPTPVWSHAELTIESPHPEAGKGQSRLSLRLRRPSKEATYGVRTAPGGEQPASMTDKMLSYVPWTGADAEQAAAPPIEFVEEVWILDVPREQVDLLLVDLARSGYFEEQSRPTAEARLSVLIDEGREAKAWDPDPRLDELAERVYSEGWIARMPAPEQAKPWWSF